LAEIGADFPTHDGQTSRIDCGDKPVPLQACEFDELSDTLGVATKNVVYDHNAPVRGRDLR
jgi:hypothetical protein